MASTLLSPNPHSCHDKAPPTSPSLQMPNVFVIPPEEDKTPTWCCFDAAEAPPRVLSTSPNLHLLDTALSMFQTETEAPVFHRDFVGPFGAHNSVIMPRKILEPRSITDFMMEDENYDSEDEMEVDYGQERPYTRGRSRSSGVGNDSEIVEVVKVRRHPHEREAQARAPTPPAKHSKSLKSRASKAFRSIKNVGKGSLRSKPRVQDIFPSKPFTAAAAAEPPPRNKSPSMSRRGSAIFSQFFPPATTLQSHSSVSSFDAVHAPPRSRQEEEWGSSSLDHSPPAADPGNSTVYTQDFVHVDARSTSPTSSAQTFSNRRRFSMLSLQRLFSFPADTDSSESASPSMSRDSTGPSTASSSSGPDTPTDEAAPLPAYQLQLHLLDIDSSSPFAQKREREPVALEQEDISFEMRLDSLHFEALSFDADRF